MIKKECFTTEWIEQVASALHYNDKNLIEKVIRALSLLEMLVGAGCPLVFNGRHSRGQTNSLRPQHNRHSLS